MRKVLEAFLIFFSFPVFFFIGSFFYFYDQKPIDLSILEKYQSSKPTIILDDEGKEWARFEFDKREYVTIDKLPNHLIQSFIVSEDRDFFSHHGISFKGIFRSAIKNLVSRRIVQGASTITQQLVKLLYFNSQRTYNRKFKELLVSILLEFHYTKEQILETYLNHVYFGCGIYGVEAASQRFWGISVEKLSIAQASTLASIIQCPGRYCPLINPQVSLERRNIVINSLYSQNLISIDQYERAVNEPMNCIKPINSCCAPHVKEMIRQWLEKRYGKNMLYGGGLIVQTTINKELQDSSNQEFKKQIIKLRQDLNKDLDGGLIIIDSETGHVKSLVGGLDFLDSKFNRVTQASRQIGSVFKPLIYAQALKNGFSPLDILYDEPLEISQPGQKVWKPKNYNKQFSGSMTLAKGLSFSNNITAIKTLSLAGINNICSLAKEVKLMPPGPYYSLALGCLDGTLYDLAAAFNVFTNHGVYIEPNIIKWVKGERGKKIWCMETKKKKIFDSYISDQVVSILSVGMERFKKRNNSSLSLECFGKSGTTNDSRSNWFCAGTSKYTTALCIACDDNQALGNNVYPVRTAFPIWLKIHEKLDHPPISYDPLLTRQAVNWKTGKILQNFIPGLDHTYLYLQKLADGNLVEPDL